MQQTEEAVRLYEYVTLNDDEEAVRNRAKFMMVSALARQAYSRTKLLRFDIRACYASNAHYEIVLVLTGTMKRVNCYEGPFPCVQMISEWY